MAPTDTLIGTTPGGFWFIGDILFRWVPATIAAVTQSVSDQSSPYANFTQPVSAWNVPELLANTSDTATYHALAQGWYLFTLLSLTASIPLLALILYNWLRILQIRRKERKGFEAAQRTVASKDVPRTQLRWQRVLEQSTSTRPEDWRLAILEADIMLNELLDVQGYKGETMGDKMKRVDRSKFNSIDQAWEAHLVRNKIAHEGTGHEMTAREARRVIALYERVFKEFHFVE